MAERWGTRIMGGEGDELTAAMVIYSFPALTMRMLARIRCSERRVNADSGADR